MIIWDVIHMLNAISLLSLTSFIVCISVGLIVYFEEVRYVFDNKLGKIFTLLCLSLAFFWAIIEFGYRSANNFETAYFWVKLNIMWYFVISFLLHFSLVFTENYKILKNKLTYVIIYGPALIFLIIDLTTNELMTIPSKEYWGWSYGLPTNGMLHSLSSNWAAFNSIFCLYIFVDYIIKTRHTNKKKHAGYAIVGVLIPIAIGLHTEWLFPLLSIKFPELIVPALTSGFVIIWYSIWVYEPIKNKKRYNTIRKEVDILFKKIKKRDTKLL